MITAYVSGHGYGHATRTAEVLRVVRELRPEAPITIVSSAPEPLFANGIGGRFRHRPLQCDVGLAQRGALVIDEEGTVARWRAFVPHYPRLVADEARWLRASGASVVLGDIPPLAFDAAAEAGLPAVGLANFSWDWIYRHLADRQPALAAAADDAARAYARATLLLELPFAGDLSAFEPRQAIPLVARTPRVAPHEARRRLALPGDRPTVLLSFGGFGLSLGRSVLEDDDALHVLASDEVAGRLDALGLGYEDLVAAVDVVVSKPGYGIVSDVIGARGRLVYTERGDFPEYPILVREMPQYLPAVHISNQDLLAGRLAPAVRTALALPLPPPAETRGAEVAARQLLNLL